MAQFKREGVVALVNEMQEILEDAYYGYKERQANYN